MMWGCKHRLAAINSPELLTTSDGCALLLFVSVALALGRGRGRGVGRRSGNINKNMIHIISHQI